MMWLRGDVDEHTGKARYINLATVMAATHFAAGQYAYADGEVWALDCAASGVDGTYRVTVRQPEAIARLEAALARLAARTNQELRIPGPGVGVLARKELPTPAAPQHPGRVTITVTATPPRAVPDPASGLDDVLQDLGFRSAGPVTEESGTVRIDPPGAAQQRPELMLLGARVAGQLAHLLRDVPPFATGATLTVTLDLPPAEGRPNPAHDPRRCEQCNQVMAGPSYGPVGQDLCAVCYHRNEELDAPDSEDPFGGEGPERDAGPGIPDPDDANDEASWN